MGRWATVCTSMVVGHQFISEQIAEPRTKKKKNLIRPHKLELACFIEWIQRSAVPVIKFICDRFLGQLKS